MQQQCVLGQYNTKEDMTTKRLLEVLSGAFLKKTFSSCQQDLHTSAWGKLWADFDTVDFWDDLFKEGYAVAEGKWILNPSSSFLTLSLMNHVQVKLYWCNLGWMDWKEPRAQVCVEMSLKSFFNLFYILNHAGLHKNIFSLCVCESEWWGLLMRTVGTVFFSWWGHFTDLTTIF